MAEFVKVAKVDDVPAGTRIYYEFEEETVIVFNINGTFYCIADICTHDGGPLEDGKVEGFDVVCPRHGGKFDVRNGKATCFPAVAPVPSYAVKVEGEDIWVESPDEW